MDALLEMLMWIKVPRTPDKSMWLLEPQFQDTQAALQNGVIAFSDLGFRVPGARIHLVDTFGLAHQDLNLHGTLEMQASLSETTTGVYGPRKRLLPPLVTANHCSPMCSPFLRSCGCLLQKA